MLRGRQQQGFTLLAVLFLVAVLGVGMAALGLVWETAARREKEAQLLFVGDQYRRAIESYHRATPGGTRQYPKRLQDLLLDRRFPQTVRHLRRLYADPVTGSPEWGLVKEGEGIIGVHSLSADAPMKQAGFPRVYEAFAEAASLGDWVFQARGDPPPADRPKADQARPNAAGQATANRSPGGMDEIEDED